MQPELLLHLMVSNSLDKNLQGGGGSYLFPVFGVEWMWEDQKTQILLLMEIITN